MTTDIVQHAPSSALAIEPGQDQWNAKQIAALRQLGVANAEPGDLAVFLHQCQRTGLDPFARQIYMIERKQWNNDTRNYDIKSTIQTGIDGFRLIAARTGKLDGYEDTLWCGEDGQWRDVWLSAQPPAAAKVTVIRNGSRFSAVALLREYAGTKRDGGLTKMWAEKPAIMIAKCAEALALRKAFPQDLSGLYTSEEMTENQGPVAVRNESNEPAQQHSLDAAIDEAPRQSQISSKTDERIADSEDVEWLKKCRAWVKGYAATEPERVAELEALIDARIHNLTADPEPPAPEPTDDEAQQTIETILEGEVVDA